MKRYLLFCGQKYYPLGGWQDFHGSFDSLEEAIKHGLDFWEEQENYYGGLSWWHVVDRETNAIIRDNEDAET